VAITVVASLVLPKRYSATASLVVDTRSPDPITAMLVPSTMPTQEDIVRSDRVAQRVVTMLGLDKNAAVREQWRDATGGKGMLEAWLAGRLQRGLSVIPARRESNVLTIEFSAAEGGFAAAVANAFAQAYMDVILDMKVEPAKQYARWFAGQSKALREDYETAQARLSDYQREKNIVAKDESVDAEVGRLNDLTRQLTVIQGQTADARSKQRSGSDADTLPEVMQNSVIQSLRSDVARHEAKLKEAAGNLGTNHPHYRRMQSELDELKNKLGAETRHVASGFSTSGSVSRDRESELRAAIEVQKRKLLALTRERDQISVLQRDVEAAKAAYDTISKQYSQSSLESRAVRTNVYLLSPAVEPLKPSFPDFFKYTFLAIALGTTLGIGAAFTLELLDRRIRCAEDFAALPQLAVLAVMETQKRRRWFSFLRGSKTAVAHA
jgi:chain length determinant protein EpsF